MEQKTERQKFEDATEDAHGLITDPWEVWQLAKHDAKPVVELHESKLTQCTIWRIAKDDDLYSFADREEAIRWAKEQGWRLE